MSEFNYTDGGASVSGGGFSGGLGAFAHHVFNTTPQGRAELWNAAQYGALAVLPVAVLNRSINALTPEPDDDSHSLALLAEVILQAIALFVGFVIVHRLIIYVPAYSGFPHDKLNISSIAIAVLAIMLSLKSKLGIKCTILADRLGELWSGGAGGKVDGQQQRRAAVPSGARQLAPSQARQQPLAGVQPAGHLVR